MAAPMEYADAGAGYSGSLAERLANGALTVPYALLCATEIASAIRDYHRKGLAHGEINPAAIRLHESGARLQPPGRRSRSADAGADVAAFGAVLYEMMTGLKPPAGLTSPALTPAASVMDMSEVRSSAIHLAQKCLDGSPDMKQVHFELRILGVLTRRLEAVPPGLRIADEPAAIALEPQSANTAEMPATTLEPPVVSTVVCPMCRGNTAFIPPRSLLDRLISRISRMRQCGLCGYRFIVIRFARHKNPESQKDDRASLNAD